MPLFFLLFFFPISLFSQPLNLICTNNYIDVKSLDVKDLFVVIDKNNRKIELGGLSFFVEDFKETDSNISWSASDIKIYPNPFRDEATIDLGKSVSDVVVRVMDIYGKVIEIIETKNRDKVLIKSRNKAKGTYFVEIEIDEDQIFYKKISIK